MSGPGVGEPVPASERPALRRRGRLTVFLTVLLDLLGFGMILPILPFYGQDYGASDLEIGVLFAAYSLAQLLFSPLLGKLSDRWGRRPVLLATIAVAAAAHVAFAFAGSFAVLVAARFVSGIATANLAVAQAYMADVTPRAERSKAMGMIGAAFGLGFVLGPAFGGGLAVLGRTAVPLGAAALALVNLAMAAAFLPESLSLAVREGRRSERWLDLSHAGDVLRNGPLSGLMLLILLVTGSFAMMEATLALFAQQRFGWGDAEMSATFVWIGVLGVIVQGGLIGPLVRRFGEDRLIPAGIAFLAAGLLLLPLAGGPLLFAATAGLLSVGMGLNSPATMGLLSRLADETRQGSILGLSRSFGSLARVLGPIAGTWLFQRHGPEVPFHSSGALMLVALAGSVWVTREARRRLDGEAQAEREAARRRALDLVQHGASPDPEEGR
jgi:multidrug resistance protein